MKQLPLTIFAGFISFGTLMFFFSKLGDSNASLETQFKKLSWNSSETEADGMMTRLAGPLLRAPGKIEGKTETIELRTRIVEQILAVPATEGVCVSKGDVLIQLDSERLVQERDLAKAMLERAVARKLRLENGPRTSEIEAAQQEFKAHLSPLWSAERALVRGTKLLEKKAISQQTLDTLTSDVRSLQATAAAAEARLATLQQPARLDELAAADADIRAAESRLKITQINLKRSELRAPIDGRVLMINAKIGELAGPETPDPLIVMVDTSQLHAVAEVDEFDALRVRLGQVCEITSDAREGILATGQIIEIEPQMQPKKTFGQWAGERNDTFSRQVKIALEGPIDLPIGLPIEVAIKAEPNL